MIICLNYTKILQTCNLFSLKHSISKFSFQYFERQTESFKETIEIQTKLNEQLENQNAEINDKYMQMQMDYKTLNNKNKRFWETIENLEKKCENYKFRIEEFENEKKEQICQEYEDLKLTEEPNQHEDDVTNNSENSFANCSFEFEEKVEELQEIIKDLRTQQGIDNIEKEELKAEIEDISTENQLLQHQVSSLETEIEEWKRVCEKAYKYKQLAEKYNSEFDEKFSNTVALKNVKGSKLKSSSHEVLNEAPLCGAADLLASKQKFLSSSVTHLHQPPKHMSVLSEMDSQYHDLVKRYENLLNKYHQGSDIEQDHKRSEKVQRAIQTLSWDFKTFEFESHLTKEQDDSGEKDNKSCQDCEETELENETVIDYKRLFVEIFAKLRQSKEFDPQNTSQ